MGDRVPIGVHPIMRRRALRRVNFRSHQYYLIYRLTGNAAQVVCVAHFPEGPDRVLQ